jgi:MYXO-CTERM domain-containing protein
MERLAYWASTAALAWGTLLAGAAPTTFNVNMTGQKEVTAAGVPNQGDLNGSGVGTITLDPGSGGTTATFSFNLALSGLATPPVTDFHIHTGGANTSGGVLIPFGVSASDILTPTQFSGSRSGLNSANMSAVLANPAGFYVNIHNNEFPAGAIRDQVPEPAGLILLGLGALAPGRRRRS